MFSWTKRQDDRAWLKLVRQLGPIAPFLLIGPLSGPLAYGAWRYSRARRPAMAIICVVGILDVYLGIPVVIATLLERLPHQ